MVERYAAIAEELRAWLHPKQRAFLMSKSKRRAALCTRRSGKTAGSCREFLARALTIPGWGGVYVNEIREEAKGLAWRSRTKQGIVDLIEVLAKEGKLKIAAERPDLARGADVKIDEATLTLDFRNGSQIRVFAADDQKSQDRARGGAPHVVLIDESQKYPFLATFVNEVIGPSLKDFRGETWLSGTPSEDLTGLFYDVTKNDSEQSITEREKGWEVHEWSVLDNPWFGATAEERWERAIGEELREKNVDISNPPAWVLREWFAKWTKTDARFVYSVHRWPTPIEFAPIRTCPIVPAWLKQCAPEGRDPSGISGYNDRWYDHQASILDLPQTMPRQRKKIEWLYALGADFGYNPHPFATTLWAFSPMVPDVYEMFSWKRTLVLPDWQRDCLLWFWAEVKQLAYLVGDPGGQAGANMAGWRDLTGLPIEDAEKAGKATWIEMYNNDGERGRIHLRSGSPLLHEQRHLAWTMVGKTLKEHDDRKLTDGTTPGNDCSDSGLYPYRWLISRRLSTTEPPPVHGSPEWLAAEEAKMERAAEADDIDDSAHSWDSEYT